jgi:hypothetical protein
MTLSTRVIDRLFDHLAATYGQQWMALWGAVPINDVKSLWAHELQGFAHRLEAIAYALDHLPERPPNLVQFKALCRQAPNAEAQPLPLPRADPERVRSALSTMRSTSDTHSSDGRTLAQTCIDGLIKRGEAGALSRAQRDMLASCLRTLRADDPRLQNHVVRRYVPGASSHE